MDGYSATQCIRDPESNVTNHSVPIVAMTANAMQGDREKCMDAGMDDFIAKPVDVVKLQKKLEKWLAINRIDLAETVEPAEVVEQVDTDNEDPSDEVVFDFVAMSERLMNDNDLISTVADAFLQDMPVQIEQLVMLVDNGDCQQAGAQAHKIKGAAANVGGLTLSAQASIIEQSGKTGMTDDLIQQIEQLKQQYLLLKSEIEEKIHEVVDR
jgi:HPt (histidine-containing phosphotransfer) domain-containing protein